MKHYKLTGAMKQKDCREWKWQVITKEQKDELELGTEREREREKGRDRECKTS